MAGLILASAAGAGQQRKDQCPDEVIEPLLATVRDARLRETDPAQVTSLSRLAFPGTIKLENIHSSPHRL
jgi:hypothetical protein